MPASLELQREYGDDLQVVFVESQGADKNTAEAFAWRRKWMDTGAMWTTERPLSVEGNTLPKFALLDVDGKLLLSGNPLAQKKAIEEAIAAQVENARRAPEGTPAKLAKAWTSFAKGKIGEAIAATDKLAEEPDLTEAAHALRAEMAARTQARLNRAGWMIEHGYIQEAEELLTTLQKSVKGCADFDAGIAEALQRVNPSDKSLAEGMSAELAASKDFASLLKKFREKPFDDGSVKALKKFVEKHDGTKAAGRASHLLELAALGG